MTKAQQMTEDSLKKRVEEFDEVTENGLLYEYFDEVVACDDVEVKELFADKIEGFAGQLWMDHMAEKIVTDDPDGVWREIIELYDMAKRISPDRDYTENLKLIKKYREPE
jgi:hypothetical protein